jgi:3'(2'), 5'-bisphosphate nucleotidase
VSNAWEWLRRVRRGDDRLGAPSHHQVQDTVSMLPRDDALLDNLLAVTREAGALVLDYYRAEYEVELKGPSDPVTDADHAANSLICERLEQLFPGVPVVAEESQPETFHGHRSADRVFFVDPLDGTKEFIAKNGEFVVMIGIVDQARATHGVIFAPVSGDAWLGHVGTGAVRVAPSGARTPLTPSTTGELRGATVVASRSRRGPTVQAVLDQVGISQVRTLGSAGLKGVCVADGSADLYVSPNSAGMRWDACAIDALIRAAGGEFTDSFGDPIDYRAAELHNSRGVLATNGALHSSVLSVLEALRRSRPKDV